MLMLGHRQERGVNTVTMPNFIIIGAAKAGTTALYHYLKQHPQIFLPKEQEPNFFAFETRSTSFRGPGGSDVEESAITNLEDYRSIFAPARTEIALGEISPLYLYLPGTAENIQRYVPKIKLCALLRNPVDRAFSAYMHARREGREPLEDFAAALTAEQSRIDENWGMIWRYTDMGRYVKQLEQYYQQFDDSHIKVFLYEDLQADAVAVCQQISAFVGADSSFVPRVDVQYNISGLPRSTLVRHLLERSHVVKTMGRRLAPVIGDARLRRLQASLQEKNVRRQHMNPQLRRVLVEQFTDEICRLESLIGRDLSIWLR
jgi:hypothetical protein